MVGRRGVLIGAGLATIGAGAAAGLRWSGAGRNDRVSLPQLRIATGPPGAVYRAIGGQLVKILADQFPRTQVSEIQTGASVDNLALLSTNNTELAFASLDAVVAGLDIGNPVDVTSVARLYDGWLQLIVLSTSAVRTFADLKGKPVAAGAPGSGTRFTTNRLIEVAGVRPQLVDATQDQGVDLLAAGKVAAMLSLTGTPTPAFTRLARTNAFRLIALDQYAPVLDERFPGLYTAATLPSSMYPGVAQTRTFTTPNLLLARTDLPVSVVETVTGQLFTQRERIAEGHPDANRINVRTGISTAPVRLHPGAMRYFRSAKS